MLSVDEKSQIQALDRTQPGLPMKKGRAGTMTHDYKRHGTTTAWAASSMCSTTRSGDRPMHAQAQASGVHPLPQQDQPGGRAGHGARCPPDRRQLRHPQAPQGQGVAGPSSPPFHMHARRHRRPGSTWSSASSPRSPESAYVVAYSIVDLQMAINDYLDQHNADPSSSSGRLPQAPSSKRSTVGNKRWNRNTRCVCRCAGQVTPREPARRYSLSEWWMQPAGGRRDRMAALSAAMVRRASIDRLIA